MTAVDEDRAGCFKGDHTMMGAVGHVGAGGLNGSPFLVLEGVTLQAGWVVLGGGATDYVEGLMVGVAVDGGLDTGGIGDGLPHVQLGPVAIAFEGNGGEAFGGIGVERVVMNDGTMVL